MSVTLLHGDCIEQMQNIKADSVDCVVTSPPYWGLRDYGVTGQLGAEETPQEFVDNLVNVFRGVRRVLKDEGTVWLNLGDSYYNYRPGKGSKIIKQTLSKTDQELPSECSRRGLKQDGLKEKDLVGIPWRVAFALQADGWYLRQDIIWSSRTRCLNQSKIDARSRMSIFFFSRSRKNIFLMPSYQA